MKTTLMLVFLLLVSSLNVFAQEKDLKEIYTEVTTAINSALLTRSGAMEISGFLSYTYFGTKYTYDEKRSQQTVQIEPVFSYFFVDNISLGIDLSYLHQKTDYESSQGSTTLEQTFIGPIAKNVFWRGEI